MPDVQKITPCLWFDGQAEQAAQFYTSIFKNSKITKVSHYPKEAAEVHGQEPGSVLAVEFSLDGQTFTGLNGGPAFEFNEAISFHVHCETQAEIDYFWKSLSAVPAVEQCGWLKDKFGVSWQIVPRNMGALMSSSDAAASGRAMQAMMKMKKLDIAELERAFAGK
jgi:predicted 3-demethylubiquinone-9 3-methyltransferase (glyoxalase superfamily)